MKWRKVSPGKRTRVSNTSWWERVDRYMDGCGRVVYVVRDPVGGFWRYMECHDWAWKVEEVIG